MRRRFIRTTSSAYEEPLVGAYPQDVVTHSLLDTYISRVLCGLSFKAILSLCAVDYILKDPAEMARLKINAYPCSVARHRYVRIVCTVHDGCCVCQASDAVFALQYVHSNTYTIACILQVWTCGVVWCGVVWTCGVVWCGLVVWCDVMWCGVVWCGVVWCGGGQALD